MREYRGKRIDNGEMVEGEKLTSNGKTYIVVECETSNEYGDGTDLYATEWYEVDTKTVGQYTGLKDKNGKDICEGDIFVDNSYGEDVGQLIDSVVWSNEKGAWAWGKDEFAIVAESVDTIMVIGNIYDNPDLLGG
ncbi:YopX protein [compost metagenome]